MSRRKTTKNRISIMSGRFANKIRDEKELYEKNNPVDWEAMKIKGNRTRKTRKANKFIKQLEKEKRAEISNKRKLLIVSRNTEQNKIDTVLILTSVVVKHHTRAIEKRTNYMIKLLTCVLIDL